MVRRASAQADPSTEAEFASRVTSGSVTFAFIDMDGNVVEPPAELYRTLMRTVDIVAEGNSPALVAVEQELTTQQAADIIGVSRPHLVSMLDHGALPYRKVGNRRRIPTAAVLEAKRRHDALRELTRLSQEYGLEP